MIRVEATGAWLLCVGLAAGAVWVAWPTHPEVSRLCRLTWVGRQLPAARRPRVDGRPLWQRWRWELLLAAAGAAAGFMTGHAAPALLSPLGAVLARRWRRSATRRQHAAAQRAEVRRFCSALVAELRSGRPPREAACRAAVALPGGFGGPGAGRDPRRAGSWGAGSWGAGSWGAGSWGADPGAPGASPGASGARPHRAGSCLAAIGRAAASGGEVTEALNAAAQAPGAEGLRRVAACWLVAEHRGAALADAIDRLVDGLRDEESHRQEIAAQLSGARATARLLAVLPVFGLLLGAGLGARPVDVLVGTAYGVGCLLLGIALDLAGLIWTERLARAAEGVG